MRFSVDPRMFQRFAGLNLGVVVVRTMDNRGESEELRSLIRREEETIDIQFAYESLAHLPKIMTWRRAYSGFGAKPSKYKSSVESLYRAVLRGKGLRPINRIVDAYNLISLKYMLPVGGDDLDKIDGDIRLGLAKGGELFVPLNSLKCEVVQPGEVVYADDKEILCRRWNWRECDKTKMTEDTSSAILFVEGLPPVEKDEVEAAANDLSRLIQRFCGGDLNIHLLDSLKPGITL